MKKWFGATFLAVMVGGTASAAVRFVPMEEIAAEADTGVVGRVVDKYCAWDNEHKMIWTHYIVDQMQHVFGKDVEARFELNFAGGTVDGKTMIVTETPEPEIGQEYVFFVYDATKKFSAATVGHFQGLFKIVRNPQTGFTQLVNGENRLVGGDEDGRIIAGPGVTVDADNHIHLAPLSREEAGTPEAEPVIRDYRGQIVPEGARAIADAPGEKPLAPIDADAFIDYMRDLRARIRGEK
ncbi:MAG: hypothetical protein HYX75_22785 [Acidobacteria bacterium]|nr:hypothetical protein [Acidobacteriota bacterium]